MKLQPSGEPVEPRRSACGPSFGRLRTAEWPTTTKRIAANPQLPASAPSYQVFGGLLAFPPAGVKTEVNWGKGGDFDLNAFGLNAVTGRYTAGNSMRHADNIIVAWMDGHANKKKAGQLGAGTGFRFDKTGTNTSLTTDLAVPTADPGLSQYVWDLQ